MADTKKSSEIQAEYQKTLGKEFGDAFFYVKNEWIDVWVTWNQYQNLFGSGPERVELMNKSGPMFFHMVQRHFFEATLLGLCRLSDPPKTGKKRNLTVMLLCDFMDTSERCDRLSALLDKVSVNTKFARDWRNRRISHNDLDLKHGAADPLEKATRESVTVSLNSVYEVLAYVSIEFLMDDLVNDVIVGFDNEFAMLERLYLGNLAREEEIRKLKSEGIRPSDRPIWLYKS